MIRHLKQYITRSNNFKCIGYSNQYGSFEILNSYIGESSNRPFKVFWNHGVTDQSFPYHSIPNPLFKIDDIHLEQNLTCLLTNEYIKNIFSKSLYNNSFAVGLPYCYLPNAKPIENRIAHEVLFFPMHGLKNQHEYSSRRLKKTRESIKKLLFIFDNVIIVCHSADFKLYKENLAFNNRIKVILGASNSDGNSLFRLRNLFTQHTFMYTDGFGSHVGYALSEGVKVSISNDFFEVLDLGFLENSRWQQFPEAMNFWLNSGDYILEQRFNKFGEFIENKGFKDNVKLGEELIGAQFKREPKEMRKILSNSLGILRKLYVGDGKLIIPR